MKVHKTFPLKVVEKRDDGGRIVISTAGLDRDKDHVLSSGAIIENYLKNPIVQWGHNYRDPWATVGKTNELKIGKNTIEADFDLRPPANDNDPQNIVLLLWNGGWIRTASIGFYPTDYETNIVDNDFGGKDYLEWELLEWSLVPIPSNQDALRLAIKAMEFAEPTLSTNQEIFVNEYTDANESVEKTVIPYRDTGTTEEGNWRRPTLSQFTGESFSDLNATQRRRIANHFTWTANMPPEKFGDLKLPHHVARTEGIGPAHRRGVTAAMGALLGARGGVDIPDGDKRRVYNHLSKHYRQFDMEPPDFHEYDEAEFKELFPELYEDIEQAEPDMDIDDELTEAELDELQDIVSEITKDLRGAK